MKDPRRNLRAYRRASAALKKKARRLNLPCWRCGKPIDYELPYYDAQAFTADHVVPLNVGGSILGPLRPAHRACNSSRGDGTREKRVPTTRQW